MVRKKLVTKKSIAIALAIFLTSATITSLGFYLFDNRDESNNTEKITVDERDENNSDSPDQTNDNTEKDDTNNDTKRPITASLKDINSEKSFNNKYKLEEEITIKEGQLATITFDKIGVITTTGPSKIIIAEEKIDIMEGYAYILLSNNAEISTSNILSFGFNENTKLIANKTTEEIIFLDGNLKIDNQTIQKNSLIKNKGGSVAIENFNRKTLNTDYIDLLNYMREEGSAPDVLLDTTVPILSINPSKDFSTTKSKISIEVTTEKEIQVTINQKSYISDPQGLVKQNVDLKVGKNIIEIVAVDSSGNKSTRKITITRNEQTPEPTPPTDTNDTTTNPPSAPSPTTCGYQFDVELLNLINNYRISNDKRVLQLECKMSLAAYNHSKWMSDNHEDYPDNFSHTGEDETQAWDRCDLVGTSCQAENLAYHSQATAQDIFDVWKNSPSHNSIMLNDDYGFLGVSVVNGYATAVFKWHDA